MDSKSILLGWELGGGLGHLIRALPLVQRLRQRGHRVSIAVRDLSRVVRTFAGLDVDIYQAPVKTSRPQPRIVTPRSFAHILHNSGYGDRDELQGMATGWRSLYAAVRPDVVLADHSPTALLAARGLPMRVATIGTGFCCPPDVAPLPDFRPWLPSAAEQIQRDESAVLASVNQVLAAWRQPPLDQLSRLYAEVDACFLATFRELDHYPARRGGCYQGAWPNAGGDPPDWPSQGRGKRIFAYLKNFQALPDLLNLINQLQLPAIVYCDRLTPEMRDRCASATLHFAERRLDLAEVGRSCDFAILNGGHGATVSMLLAGKPVLQIPLNLEQTLTGLATRRMRAGLSVEPNQPAQVAQGLTRMVTSDEFDGARRFASRYAAYDPALQLERIAGRIEEWIEPAASATGAERQPASPASVGAPPAAHRPHGPPRTIVGIGSGRCGTKSLAMLLNRQPATAVSHEMRPLLPWDAEEVRHTVTARFAELRKAYPQVVRVGDVAHFYLRYVPTLLETCAEARVVCLQRDRQATIDSYLRWTVQTRGGRPVNHWSEDRSGFEPDAWDACYPKYPTRDLAAAVGRYWDEYYREVEDLARRYPAQVRLFRTEHALGSVRGIRELLAWIGVPDEMQQATIVHAHRSAPADDGSGPTLPEG